MENNSEWYRRLYKTNSSIQICKEKLIKKYDAEFAKKQDAIRAEYAAKISKIEKEISGVIEKEAKAKGYDLILSNSVVLYGGNDITKEIAKKIK